MRFFFFGFVQLMANKTINNIILLFYFYFLIFCVVCASRKHSWTWHCTSINSQFFVQWFCVACTTDRSKLLVKSICETTTKSLFCAHAATCVPGFEYALWLVKNPIVNLPIKLNGNLLTEMQWYWPFFFFLFQLIRL